jgi:UDP-N-acetyl-D-galactosamine dehydrogenase
MLFSENPLVVVIGLGYVGLPLAVQFAKTYRVIGFDTNNVRIEQLVKGSDKTGEVTDADLSAVSGNISFTSDTAVITEADMYIVAVPTPITRNNVPDLNPLDNASRGH